MKKFTSTKKYYYFYRYGFLSISLLLLILSIYLIGTGSVISINDIEKEATISNTWPMLLIAVIVGLIHLLVYRKAAYIEINEEKIRIESAGGIFQYNIDNIEKINQIQFLRPPLYRLKLIDPKKSYFFVVYDFYVDFGGFISDLSTKRTLLDEIKEKTLHNKT